MDRESMTSRWSEVKDHLAIALDMTEDERAVYLEQLRADDAALHAEVSELLGTNEDDSLVVDQPVVRLTEPTDGPLLPNEIGPYQILGEIGQGGMGTVYLAKRYDDAYAHKVALKILKRGMDTVEIVNRFRTERDILANLNHPHIAQLQGGGTTDNGLPYFVMEYIEGQPITEYCDERKLSLEERLKLFGKVCDAVHFAHRNQVIHRDLKPSNILISNKGVPKLLDFGIAKLVSPNEQQTQTATHMRALTPEYASPEQLTGDLVTTSSDIYALGVLLYELLTGRRPFYWDSREEAVIRRMMEGDLPPRPSSVITRTLTTRSKQINPQLVSANRSIDIRRLRRSLKGDLDNIVLMALRREPENRYDSARQMADDISRHLTGHPVLANGESLGYLFRAFLNRYKGQALLGTLLVGALISSAGLYQQSNAVKREQFAREQVTDLTVSMMETLDPFKIDDGSDMGPDGLLRSISERLNHMGDAPEIRIQLLTAMGRVLLNRGNLSQAGPLINEAHLLSLELFDGDSLQVGEATLLMGRIHQERWEYAKAAVYLDRALEIRRKHYPENHPKVAEALVFRNDLMVEQAFEESGPIAVKAYEILEPEKDLYTEAFMVATIQYGESLRRDLRMEEARDLYMKTLDMHQDGYGNRVTRGQTLLYLGLMNHILRDWEEAKAYYMDSLELLRSSLGVSHPKMIDILAHLSGIYSTIDRDKSLELANLAIEKGTELLGSYSPRLIASHAVRARHGKDYLMMAHHQIGIIMENVALRDDLYTQQQIDIWQGDQFPFLARDLMEVGEEWAEAERLFRLALDSQKRRYGEDSGNIALCQSMLGELLYYCGQFEEAESLFIKVIMAIEKEPERLLSVLDYPTRFLSQMQERKGELAAARYFMRETLMIQIQHYQGIGVGQVYCHLQLARYYWLGGDQKSALDALDIADQILTARNQNDKLPKLVYDHVSKNMGLPTKYNIGEFWDRDNEWLFKPVNLQLKAYKKPPTL